VVRGGGEVYQLISFVLQYFFFLSVGTGRAGTGPGGDREASGMPSAAVHRQSLDRLNTVNEKRKKYD